MMVTITVDDISVSGEDEKAALKALRKAQRAAEAKLAALSVLREQARTVARVNAWRLLDAFVDGFDSRPHWDYIATNTAYGPRSYVKDDVTYLHWQTLTGQGATLSWYGQHDIEGGICDAAGWLIAVRVDHTWYAVGATDDGSGACAEKLPDSFNMPVKE